jgi:hypothetical protein
MGIQRDETIPESFAKALDVNYLGNPDTVNSLVSRFCAEFSELLQNLKAGSVDKAQFVESTKQLINQYADIFSGRNASYTTIAGYNNRTLPIKLKADLGEFWQKQRSSWNDDPVCVLFEWLAMILAEKIKLADGDDMLLGVMFKPSIQYTVQVLLGIEQRVRP